jgi:drug/metabolite transporter (DMT)-like permease
VAADVAGYNFSRPMHGRISEKVKKRSKTFYFRAIGRLGAFPSQVLMTYGTQYSLASNAAILILALPVVTAVFAFFILKEKMNRSAGSAFGIAIIGCTALLDRRYPQDGFELALCGW